MACQVERGGPGVGGGDYGGREAGGRGGTEGRIGRGLNYMWA
jgi:hypothetical protein